MEQMREKPGFALGSALALTVFLAASPGVSAGTEGACRDRDCREPVPVLVSEPEPVVDGGMECGSDIAECPDPGDMEEPVMEEASLAERLQRELMRVGCFHSVIDGFWGPVSIQALENFNHWHGAQSPVDRPSEGALQNVLSAPAPVCGVD